ncbi:hypothetical protein EDC04DRAFT_2043745 [Pisolithus marmoratus]|nr:hypothetical protein EDC04DRAFT_2043745 [Pisolithus marmoratus]
MISAEMFSSYHMQIGMAHLHCHLHRFLPRAIKRCNPAKRERTHILERNFHRCKKWILAESLKDPEIKVLQFQYFSRKCNHNRPRLRTSTGTCVDATGPLGSHLCSWKHATACHQGTHIEDDDDVYCKFGNLVCDSTTPAIFSIPLLDASIVPSLYFAVTVVRCARCPSMLYHYYVGCIVPKL